MNPAATLVGIGCPEHPPYLQRMGRSGRQRNTGVRSRSVSVEPRPATPVEGVLTAFHRLSAAEQEDAFAALHEARLLRLAGEGSEAALFVRAMREAAEIAGRDLTPDDYKSARDTLRGDGVELPSFTAILKHFGSWRQAKEALALADIEAPDRIAARFRARRVGKMHSFNEQALRDALAECTRFLGRPPLVAEYEAWRARELELAHDRDDRGYELPSPGTFRRRYKTWPAALLHFGYSPEEIYVRLEPQGSRRDSDRYTDETLREVLLRCAREIGHVPLVESSTRGALVRSTGRGGRSWRCRATRRTAAGGERGKARSCTLASRKLRSTRGEPRLGKSRLRTFGLIIRTINFPE